MAEQKYVRSSPPVRTPKSQLAVKQPSTGRCWNPPKNIPHVQRQRSCHSKIAGGAKSWWNQIPYALSGWPMNWRTIIPKKIFSHCCEVSEHHISIPIMRTWQRHWESPRNLALEPSWLKLMPTDSVMLSNQLILCHPLLLLPSIFPRIGVFSNEIVKNVLLEYKLYILI